MAYDSSPGGTRTRSRRSTVSRFGRAAAVRDPRSGAGAHHGLERRHEPARRVEHPDAPVGRAVVDVRLPVREDDDAVAVKGLAEHVLEPLRRPRCGGRAALGGEVGDELAHVRDERVEGVPAARRAAGGAAGEGKNPPQLVGPGPPPCAANEDREDRREQRHHAECAEGEALHRELAPGHEAQVMDEHERAADHAVVLDRVQGHVHPPALELVGEIQLHRPLIAGDTFPQRLAGELAGEPLRPRDRGELGRAGLRRHDPLVAREVVQERGEAAPVAAPQVSGERTLCADGGEPCAQGDVPHEPGSRRLVHHRRRAPGQHAEPQDERHHHTEERPHAAFLAANRLMCNQTGRLGQGQEARTGRWQSAVRNGPTPDGESGRRDGPSSPRSRRASKRSGDSIAGGARQRLQPGIATSAALAMAGSRPPRVPSCQTPRGLICRQRSGPLGGCAESLARARRRRRLTASRGMR